VAALQAELKTTQEALAEATARQATRDAAVNDLVTGLKKKEAAVQKPAQVVAALPGVLTLPAPITIESELPAVAGEPYTGKSSANAVEGIQPKVNFPVADLKPLYDFAADRAGREVVCDWSGGRGDCGESCAVVITPRISSAQPGIIPQSLRKPTDPERSWLAHPPRQPGQTLREELK
jgi:hypothetical protein